MSRPAKPRTRVHDIEIHMDYFLRHQRPNAKNDCIDWDAGMHKQGYGMIGAWRISDGQKIMTTVHRVVARLHFDRPFDSDEMVIHTCSNPKCCNPEHLMVGDRKDVHRVMRANGRYKPGGRPYKPKS